MRKDVSGLLLLTFLIGLPLSAPGQMMGPTGQGEPMREAVGGRMFGLGHPPGGAPGIRRGAHEGPLISIMLEHGEELGLTADQKKKLRELRTEFEKTAIRQTAELRIAEIELDALLEEDRWDMAQIEPKVTEIAFMRGELRLARIKTLEAGRAVLTPEQLQQLRQVGHEMPPAPGPARLRPAHPMAPGAQSPPGRHAGPGMPQGPEGPTAPRP